MYMIAGLGNPSKKYEKTRHNMGFDVIDKLAEKYAVKMKISRFTARIGKTEIGGQKVLLVKPQTYMNLSGEAVLRIAAYYKIDIENKLIVVYDDTDIDIGKIRIKSHGSAGGHNGMKSIISRLGSEGFARIRIGIGKRDETSDMIDFVLGRFSADERKKIETAQQDACAAIEDIMQNGIDHAMNEFN